MMFGLYKESSFEIKTVFSGGGGNYRKVLRWQSKELPG